MRYLTKSAAFRILLCSASLSVVGCKDPNPEPEFVSENPVVDGDLSPAGDRIPSSDSVPTVQTSGGPVINQYTLNADSEQGQHERQSFQFIVHQDPVAGNGSASEGNVSGKTASGIVDRTSDEEKASPQGQYDLAKRLVSESLLLRSKRGSSREEEERMLVAAATWHRKSAMQGYRLAIPLMLTWQKQLGLEEMVIWSLVNMHVDQLTRRMAGVPTAPHQRVYSAMGMRTRSLSQGETKRALKKATEIVSRLAIEGYLTNSKVYVYGDHDLALWREIIRDFSKHGNLGDEATKAFDEFGSELDEQTNKSGFAMTAVIKLPKGEIVAGDTVLITVCATNASDDALATPLQKYSNFETNALGGLQCWIERLGPETEIAAIPAQIARAGKRYAAGGFPFVHFASKLDPGKSAVTQKKVKTEGFPAGQYRYYIDLQPFGRNIPKTSAVLQFTVK